MSLQDYDAIQTSIQGPSVRLIVDASGENHSGELPDALRPSGSLRRLGFFLMNCWLVFHLFAIVVCPASVEPASPLMQYGFEIVSPYLHFLYLDHGFHFFAPEPGASTLVSYELTFPDGSTKTGQFPSREIFPRLFYHRHFMLTEFLGNGPEDLQPLVERAFARNLCRATGAVSVSLTKVEHETASIQEIRRGVALTDPSLFKKSALGTYTAEELRLPFKPITEDSASNETPADATTPTTPPPAFTRDAP